MKLTIPELALVVLIGPSGCGKSTFARKHFKPTEVLSSDYCRGLVSDDENNQAAKHVAMSCGVSGTRRVSDGASCSGAMFWGLTSPLPSSHGWLLLNRGGPCALSEGGQMKKEATNRADDEQGEEKTKHQVHDLQRAVDERDRETEQNLPPRFKRCRRRVGNHVEGKDDEGGAGHRHEGNNWGDAEILRSNESL